MKAIAVEDNAMTNGQRTVTSLLAVVAVMLGLNLIVRGWRPV